MQGMYSSYFQANACESNQMEHVNVNYIEGWFFCLFFLLLLFLSYFYLFIFKS